MEMPAKGDTGLNPLSFIEAMSSYEFLMVSLFSMAMLTSKLLVRAFFPPCIVIEIYCTTGESFEREELQTTFVSYYRMLLLDFKYCFKRGDYPLSDNCSFPSIIVPFIGF